MSTADPMTPRCSASSKQTGKQCGARPIPGGTVCRWHGGAAPQVQKAARQRILEAADLAAATLIGLMQDDTVPHAVRVTAARDLLDRAGEGAKQQIEVTTHDGDLADLDAALAQWTARDRTHDSAD